MSAATSTSLDNAPTRSNLPLKGSARLVAEFFGILLTLLSICLLVSNKNIQLIAFYTNEGFILAKTFK